MLLEALSPNYALAAMVPENDSRIKSERVSYNSANGHGSIKGLMVRPASGGKKGGVVVVHENRGLNPYIEDVARRVAVAGFTALAPDGLTPLGGYPGNDAEGRTMQRQLDRGKLLPRERLAHLLDPGAPWVELWSIAGYRMNGDEDGSTAGGNLITGIGFVAGRRVLVMVWNYAIKGGTINSGTANCILAAIA